MAQVWTQLLTTQLEDQIKFEEDRQQKATKRAWQLNAALVRSEMAHELSEELATKEDETLDNLVRETVLNPHMFNNIVHNGDDVTDAGDIKVHPRAPRLGGIGSKMEDYARHKALRYYLAHEKLLPPNAPCFIAAKENGDGSTARNIITDEEYLTGVIGLCHDLGKHGVTRASNAVDDETTVPFIKRARDAVSLILEELLQFDFRNGPLRRKYDSTKYALKTLETVLYELSVAGDVGGHDSLVIKENLDDGGPLKRMKLDGGGAIKSNADADDIIMQEGSGTSLAIPKKEIREIRERTDHRDKLRESLIKTCRDGQKSAKQAIFALHRGDAKRAATLLSDVEKCVTDDLLPTLKDEPMLRHGSFAGVLEEYVEGKLFYTWLYGDNHETTARNVTTARAVGKILLLNEIPLKLSTEDYLGGLCDLIGEIGRFAVARGTVRDKESVRLCLDSSKAIYMTLKMLGKVPRNVTKKMSMVSKSVEKLERVLYEQSLMEMTGRKEFASGMEVNNAAFDNAFGDDN